MLLSSLLGPILGLVCAGHLVRDGYLRRTPSPSPAYPPSTASRSHSTQSRRRQPHRRRTNRRAAQTSSSSGNYATTAPSILRTHSRSRTPSTLQKRRYSYEGNIDHYESDSSHHTPPTRKILKNSNRGGGRYYAQHPAYLSDSPSREVRRSSLVPQATVAGMTAAAAASATAAGVGRRYSPRIGQRGLRRGGFEDEYGDVEMGGLRSGNSAVRGEERRRRRRESTGTVCTSSSCASCASCESGSSGDSDAGRGRARRRELEMDRRELRRLRKREKREKRSDELGVSEGKN